MEQTLLQFINAVQLRLMHSLLDVAPYLVIDRIKVGAIRRSGRMKVDVLLKKDRIASRARCAGAMSSLKIKKSPDRSHITGFCCDNPEHVAVIAAVDLYP